MAWSDAARAAAAEARRRNKKTKRKASTGFTTKIQRSYQEEMGGKIQIISRPYALRLIKRHRLPSFPGSTAIDKGLYRQDRGGSVFLVPAAKTRAGTLHDAHSARVLREQGQLTKRMRRIQKIEANRIKSGKLPKR